MEPLDGMVKRHNHLKIGWYHQHLAELLDLSLTPLEYMFREFPEVPSRKPVVQPQVCEGNSQQQVENGK